MTASGFMKSAAARTSSSASIPLVPRTPGFTQETLQNPENASGICAFKCRVTRRFPSVHGPKASGESASFPSPAQRTLPGLCKNCAASLEIASAAASKLPASRRESAVSSSVTYRPTGFPSARAPRSSRISTRVMWTPSASSSRATTPGSSVVSPASFFQSV